MKNTRILGIDVWEDTIARCFPEIERAPSGNRGYDFCFDGLKIDAKARHLDTRNIRPKWSVHTNPIAECYLIGGFNSDHICIRAWLIPRSTSSKRGMIIIYNDPEGLLTWHGYEIPIPK